ARVAGLLAGGASKAEITFERTIAELAAIGFSQVTNFMRIGEDGLPILDFSNLTDEDRIALAEVTVTRIGRITRIHFKLHDKLRALDQLAKLMGWYIGKHEHIGPSAGPIVFVSGFGRARDDH